MEAAGMSDPLEKDEHSPEPEMDEILPQVEEDPRFYTLAELQERELILEAQCTPYGNANLQSAHILLTPQEYRAKLYSLNMDNKWIDIGTGHFRILLSKDNEEHYMQIISENVLLDEGNNQSGENLPDDGLPKESDELPGETAQMQPEPEIPEIQPELQAA